MRSTVVIFGLIVLILGAGLVFVFSGSEDMQPSASPLISRTPTFSPTTSVQSSPSATRSPSSLILHTVPFAAQAPFGNWEDDRQQDGCEEASVVMAVRWARGQSLTSQQMLDEIFAISAYEQREYGSYHDTSAEDTAERILKGYFNYTNYSVEHDINAQDIIDALAAGHLVITPMNGQILKNPYFTAPGPERHMLVVIGYDPVTKKFITNDPGTRQGKSFRYTQQNFVAAWRDYVTGYHAPITEDRTSMIIVKK